MPLGLFDKCAGLIDRLTAEASVLEVQRIGIGTRRVMFTDVKTKRPLLEIWQEMAHGDDEEKPPRVYPTADQVRAMGLKVFGPKAT